MTAAAPSRREAFFKAALVTVAAPAMVAYGFAVCSRSDARKARAASEADIMAALHAEADALRAAAERALSDDVLDHLTDRLDAVERRAIALHVSTPAGAIAALEWVRADLLRDDGAYTGFGFYPDLIGQALDVLRSGGAS